MDMDKQKYYETMFDLFLHPGWKHVITACEDKAAGLGDVRRITSVEALNAVQGQLHVLDFILTLESVHNVQHQAELHNEAVENGGD